MKDCGWCIPGFQGDRHFIYIEKKIILNDRKKKNVCTDVIKFL